MQKEEIIQYCLTKPSTYMDYPFGKEPICFKVGGKIFAQLNTNPDHYKITLKADPEKSYFYREVYPDYVVRGYHCPPVQQPYWNTVTIDGFGRDMLLTMIDEAYEEVIRKLTKKEKVRLSNICSLGFKTTLYSQNKMQINAYNTQNMVVGTVCLEGIDHETAELTSLNVEESFRGQGIAKELLRRLDSEARKQDYRFILVTLSDDLPEIHSLFKKMLYKKMEEENKYIRKL